MTDDDSEEGFHFNEETGSGVVAIVKPMLVVAYHARNDPDVLKTTFKWCEVWNPDHFDFLFVNPNGQHGWFQQGTANVVDVDKLICSGCCRPLTKTKSGELKLLMKYLPHPGVTIGSNVHRNDSCESEGVRMLGFYEILYSKDEDAVDNNE